MRRYSLTARRLILVIASALLASMAIAASAQAVLVNDNGTEYGVALTPNTTLPAGLQVSTSGSCNDPSLAPDLSWATIGDVSPLCYHGGSVLTSNETYVLTWDPDRRYWATTRQYVEQFLSDVASASGTFGSPFALLPQYTETVNGQLVHAQNKSVFAGGCVDYGNNSGGQTGYTCQFGANAPSGTGNNYPTNGCTPSGTNVWYGDDNGPLGDEPNPASNDVCLTDAQIKTELQDMLPQMGLPGGNRPGISRWSTCCSQRVLRCALTPPATSARPTALRARSSAVTTRRSRSGARRSRTWCSRGRLSSARASAVTIPTRRRSPSRST